MKDSRSLFTVVALLCGVAIHTRAQGTADSAHARGDRAGQLLAGADVANDPALADAINTILSDTNAHMRMAPTRPATRADSARAMTVADIARNALGKYKDVHQAESDGFIRFLPNVEPQSIYHYTNYRNAVGAMFGLDPARPTSLLYRRDKTGNMVLVGVMYTAPWTSTPDDLDARLPLGIAHWHEHVNFCGPTAATVREHGKPSPADLAKWLRITTEKACGAAGGRFTPRLFGWMVHAYVFAGTDPKVVWGGEGKGHMHM